MYKEAILFYFWTVAAEVNFFGYNCPKIIFRTYLESLSPAQSGN